MKVRMLRTGYGADDRVTLRTYAADAEYEMSDELAREFIAMGIAQAVADRAPSLLGPDDIAMPAESPSPRRGSRNRRG
jgi:hypothetical protein